MVDWGNWLIRERYTLLGVPTRYTRYMPVKPRDFEALTRYKSRYARHEVITFTAEHEHIVNRDEALCFATGILREQAPDALRLWV